MDEVEDPKLKLDEECSHSEKCSPLLHALNSCNKRVTEHPKTPETCQQELFDLITCTAPKLFKQLK